jgi:hypothetical protein
MVAMGLTEEIRDLEVYNYFRFHGALNVHSEYGYLVNATTAREISAWWRAATGTLRVKPDRDSAL